jgi:hypothetical protein
MANYFEIQQTFNAYLATMPNLPEWERENLILDPEENEIFIKTELIPARTTWPNIGEKGFKVESGIFEVQVKAVRQKGWGQFSNLVDDILDYFPRGLRLASDPDSGNDPISILILRSYANAGYFDSNGRYSIPVHVRYETYILIN